MVNLVRSDANKADQLTRVPQRWLHRLKENAELVNQMRVGAVSELFVFKVDIQALSVHYTLQGNPAVTMAEV